MEIINKVAQSGIVTFNLEDYFPSADFAEFDLKDYLFRGLILKEKDFREALTAISWKENYAGKVVCVFCSADAIIPNWAYMLVTVYAQPFAAEIFMGNKEQAVKQMYSEALKQINLEEFNDQRVVIKGCSNKPVPVEAYLEITKLLRPVAKSIMYGEPCSTVPLFKRKVI